MPSSDEQVGISGLVADSLELAQIVDQGPAGEVQRTSTLALVDAGVLAPDPDSRLGAYDATRGYSRGTVGCAVHHAIGILYIKFGAWGQERIGSVFNSVDAKRLYREPLRNSQGASLAMATIEYGYWVSVLSEDPFSAGAQLATRFDPKTRDWLQRNVFCR